MPITEAGIERAVTAFLHNNYGIRHIKTGKNGWPDQEYLLGKGASFYVEFKKPGEEPSKLQRERLDWLCENYYACGWADNFQDAVAMVLQEFIRIHKPPLNELKNFTNIARAAKEIRYSDYGC